MTNESSVSYFAEKWSDKYWHPGSLRYVQACARKESLIVPVVLIESKTGAYWGWLDTDGDRYVLVQPHEGMFDMQFAYGAKAEEQRGRGRIVQLDILETPDA